MEEGAFGDYISWRGWDFDFAVDIIALTSAKLRKLRNQLQELRQGKKISRQQLQQCLGLLVWATSIGPHLRPFMAPLYRDLHSPPGTMYAVHANQWRLFLDSLTTDLKVGKQGPGLFIPLQARVLEYGGRRVFTKTDIPVVPKSSKPQYIRASNSESSTTSLQKDSKECLDWLLDTFSSSPWRPLADPPCLICLAAAAARADGDLVGIGGWMVTSSALVWFGETWTVSELRHYWPFLTKKAQTYIASFETLAQLVLIQAAHYRLRYQHASFKLPSGSDNTAAEAGSNTLFSTAWPLSYFLRLTAGWAYRHGVALQVSHISGKVNTWADELSRENLSRFSHRQGERFRPSLRELASADPEISLHPASAPWRLEHYALSRVPEGAAL